MVPASDGGVTGVGASGVGNTSAADRATGSMGLDGDIENSTTGPDDEAISRKSGEEPDPCKGQVAGVTNVAASHDEVDVAAGIFADVLKNPFGPSSSLFLDPLSPPTPPIPSSIPAELCGGLRSQNPGNILAFLYPLICSFDYRALF